MQVAIQRHTQSLPAWIAQADRAVHVNGSIEHMAQFILVFRRHDLHIGQYAHKGDIEEAMLRRTILADHTRSVHSKDNVEILDTYIMENLIKSTLHKSRVNGRYRPHAL